MKFIPKITGFLRKAKQISAIVLIVTAIVDTLNFLADRLDEINGGSPSAEKPSTED